MQIIFGKIKLLDFIKVDELFCTEELKKFSIQQGSNCLRLSKNKHMLQILSWQISQTKIYRRIF